MNALRHFEPSGKLIGSAIPADSVGQRRTMLGYLGLDRQNLGWYSAGSGSRADRSIAGEAYLDLSPADPAQSHAYAAAPRKWNDVVEGFALTPSGRVYVQVFHAALSGHPQPPELYELDRTANTWLPVDAPRNQQGDNSTLAGNDGEALVFSEGPAADRSQVKLQVVDLSETAKP